MFYQFYQLIAQGTRTDIANLSNYQSSFEENSKGRLDLELVHPAAANAVAWLDTELGRLGVPEHKVVAEGNLVKIYFKTEIAPLVLIAAALAVSIVILALLVAWKLYKLSPISVALSIIAIIAIIAAVIALISVFGSLAGRGFKLGGK